MNREKSGHMNSGVCMRAIVATPSQQSRKLKARRRRQIFAWEQRRLVEVADRYDNLRVPITASGRISGSPLLEPILAKSAQLTVTPFVYIHFTE
jgi:hypothetical protein